MIAVFRNFFSSIVDIFGNKKKLLIGLYGPPNSGKTTLAKRIIKDLLNSEEEFGEVSSVAHETRKIVVKEKLVLTINGKRIEFDLFDTPGIATRIDYETFVKSGMSSRDAKQRAREATCSAATASRAKRADRNDVPMAKGTSRSRRRPHRTR